MEAVTKSGYKMTEVGLIPSDWEVKELFSVCDVRDGTHDSPRYFKTGVKFVTSKNIIEGSLDFADISYVSERDAFEINKRSKVEKGDILMSMIGTIGNAVLIKFEPDFCIKNVALIKPKLIDGEFLIQLIYSPFYQTYIKNNLDGGIQKFISLGVLRSLDCLIPPLPEQTAIANALKDTDDLINSLENLIAKKKLIKQGAMQELLKPKDGWVKKKLGEVCEVLGGGTPSTTNSEFWNGDINWFTPTEIGYQKYSSKSKRKISRKGLENSSAQLLPIGTILLTTRASIGEMSILNEVACTNQGFQSLLPKDGNHNEFIYYLMDKYKGVLIQNASGSTFLEISPNKIRQMVVEIPDYNEQLRIATILCEIDLAIEVLEFKLSKLQTVKQGMMQQLLTGKIRLV